MKQPFKVLTRTDEITHDEWLDYRRTGLGGSDAGTVLGKSRWASPFSLWAEKTGKVESNFTGNEATEWGNELELSVAKRYAKTTNKRVVAWPVMLQSTERPWQLANCDFFIVDYATFDEFPEGEVTVHDSYEAPNGISAILEIKTTGIVGRASREWENNGVPTSYYWQGVHYSAVTGIRNVTFAALVGGSGLQIREVVIPESTVEELNTAEADFWDKVEMFTEPEVTGHESDFDTLKAVYPESKDSTLVADEFLLDTLAEFRRAKQILEAAEETVKALRIQLERAIADNDSVVDFEGNTLYTYKSTKPSEAFDSKTFKATYPELYAQFVAPKAGYRVLRLGKES